MRRQTTLLTALLFLATFPAAAVDRHKTATLERLWVMEHPIQTAASELNIPLTLLPSGEKSDFRVYLLPRFSSRSAFTLYQKATGRSDDSILELYDHHGKRSLVTHHFKLDSNPSARRRAARDFLQRVKRLLAEPAP